MVHIDATNLEHKMHTGIKWRMILTFVCIILENGLEHVDILW